ncbi:hypothetical protein KC19_12G004300 [Ceratodon purpureus]|uniref:Uncharacterized protein n=1 Tax=Ceratodon purpureus TaxID=3225 RepID=A0A8T0G2K8_CERPU|nr:hypothetical protein KC19_12G004300 [Ceratodon purpureus]
MRFGSDDAPRKSSVARADMQLLSPPQRSLVTRADLTLMSPPRRSLATRADMNLCSSIDLEAPAPRRASSVSHAEMKLCTSDFEARRSSSVTHAEMKLFRAGTTREEARRTSVSGSAEMKLFSNIEQAKLRTSQQDGAVSPMSSVTLSLEKSISTLCPDVEDDEEDFAAMIPRRPASPNDYHLAIDYTAAKMLTSVIDKVKLFQCTSAQYKEESTELLNMLVSLHEILQVILGCPCLNRYQEVLEDIMLYSTKAFAFMEKLIYSKAVPKSSHGLHKTAMKMNDFACRFFNQTVRLCEDYETSDDDLRCFSRREERLSFGVTSYAVPLRNVSERLLKRKRVYIPVKDLDGRSQYNVELSYPRSWFHKEDALTAKVESSDRGFSQTLQAGRVKVQKGSWGWEEAQDTVLITYDDLMVANVAAISGSLLSHNKTHTSSRETHLPKFFNAQKYRSSIQVVGSSRIDPDLQNLYIKGVKDMDRVYYKCYVNISGHEEVLGIYRYQHQQFQNVAEGTLHIVGRGNQPGLRHVLVSIFSSLGFTTVV